MKPALRLRLELPRLSPPPPATRALPLGSGWPLRAVGAAGAPGPGLALGPGRRPARPRSEQLVDPGREPGTASERRSGAGARHWSPTAPPPAALSAEFDSCWRRETAPGGGRWATSSDAGPVLRAGFTGSEGGDGRQMCFFSNQTCFGKPPCGPPGPFGPRGPCGDRGVSTCLI